jgi:DNA processing protein
MLMTPARSSALRHHRGDGGYIAPTQIESVSLQALLRSAERGSMSPRQLEIFKTGAKEPDDLKLFYSGDIGLASRPCVSIVGTREATPDGRARASRLSCELVRGGVVIVSGLAKGIDTAAHRSAIENGGRTIAVIGTPLSKATPSENAPLQQMIWREHLLISPFPEGRPVYRTNFPQRNRVMAALSDATVIIEATDTSGTLHQAAECQRLGRWLFILRTVAENPSIKWPKRFLGVKKTAVLDRTEQIFDVLNGR